MDMTNENRADKRKLKQMNDRQTHIVNNYCNTIGCKDCPLNRKPDDCESIELQGKILDLEFKDL